MITAAVEDVTSWIPAWLSFIPKVYIVRIYDCGVEPVEPNEFRFAVVAVSRFGVAIIKALCAGVTRKHMMVGAKKLKEHGISRLKWRHEGVWHELKIP